MFIVFKNKTPIAVAFNETEARQLASEFEVAVGWSSRVKYTIVKVEHSEFFENLIK
jgi:hypothetical protein